ncbi:MAG: hypothetical protein AB1451_12375 [Nitrospirota bacterium]
MRRIVWLLVLGLIMSASPAAAGDKEKTALKFTAGVLSGDAQGHGRVEFENGAVSGKISAKDLPALPTGQFYVAWYTNIENGNAAFLGALVSHDSILFTEDESEGALRFSADAYTVHLPFPGTGDLVGQPIYPASPGGNQIVVLVERAINGRTPAPINPPASFPPGPVESAVLVVNF